MIIEYSERLKHEKSGRTRRLRPTEYRSFLIFNDSHPDFYIGRIERTEAEVEAVIWTLEPGDTFSTAPGRGVMREAS